MNAIGSAINEMKFKDVVGAVKSLLSAPLAFAAASGDNDRVQNQLAKSYVDINAKAFPALQVACFIGNVETIELLLKQPHIDVNHRGAIKKMSALSMASKEGHTDAVRVLLKHRDIDTNILDGTGTTPFYICVTRASSCKHEYAQMMRLFLRRTDIDVNVAGLYGHVLNVCRGLDFIHILLRQTGVEKQTWARNDQSRLQEDCSHENGWALIDRANPTSLVPSINQSISDDGPINTRWGKRGRRRVWVKRRGSPWDPTTGRFRSNGTNGWKNVFRSLIGI